MAAFFGIFLLLLATGVPIALALGIGGVAFLWLSRNERMILQLPQRAMAGGNQFVPRTMPPALRAGSPMNAAGITDRSARVARPTVARPAGGLAPLAGRR